MLAHRVFNARRAWQLRAARRAGWLERAA